MQLSCAKCRALHAVCVQRPKPFGALAGVWGEVAVVAELPNEVRRRRVRVVIPVQVRQHDFGPEASILAAACSQTRLGLGLHVPVIAKLAKFASRGSDARHGAGAHLPA